MLHSLFMRVLLQRFHQVKAGFNLSTVVLFTPGNRILPAVPGKCFLPCATQCCNRGAIKWHSSRKDTWTVFKTCKACLSSRATFRTCLEKPISPKALVHSINQPLAKYRSYLSEWSCSIRSTGGNMAPVVPFPAKVRQRVGLSSIA